jgi:hypothetical protein
MGSYAPNRVVPAEAFHAADAVVKAVRAGLLYGKRDGRFAPYDPATRAEAAAIVARLLNLVEQ